MKKLILTSSLFSGEVIIVYGEGNKLVLIDMQTADMTEEQIKVMKSRAPVFYTEEGFLEAFNSKYLTFIEEGITVGFEMFWNAYGIKRNKERALKYWNNLTESEKVKALYALPQYFRHLSLNSWKTKAEPDTYLKVKYFNNDYTK